MPDTGAPWNLRYPDPTDLVVDGPAQFENLADDVAAGLSASIGLVAVKSAIFAGTQSGSLGSRANYAVTNLSITHALADATNKLIISAVLGVVSNDREGFGAAIAIDDGSGLINIGENVSGVLRTSSATSNVSVTSVGNLSLHFVHAPGDTTSRTYTVRVQNPDTSTNTLFINRPADDTSGRSRTRGVSTFIIQEVRV